MDEKIQAQKILEENQTNFENVYLNINRGEIKFIDAISFENLMKYIKIIFKV